MSVRIKVTIKATGSVSQESSTKTKTFTILPN